MRVNEEIRIDKILKAIRLGTHDSWSNKARNSHNFTSISGETLRDIRALTTTNSNQDSDPIDKECT